jgi:hypothetical protein
MLKLWQGAREREVVAGERDQRGEHGGMLLSPTILAVVVLCVSRISMGDTSLLREKYVAKEGFVLGADR